MYTPVVIRGTLDRLHMGDLLQWLEMASASGRLTVRQGGWDRHIDLLDGRVVYVSSTHPAERPAAWLARSDRFPLREIRASLARSILGRGRLTDLLVDRGPDARKTLEAALESLALHVAARILFGGPAEFHFDPDYPVPGPPALTLDLGPQTLLLEAARRTDESPGWIEPPAGEPLPFTGEAFEGLFWQILEQAFPAPVELDGPALARLHRLVRDVTGTLAQWLSRSPGLVPVPLEQLETIHTALSEDRIPDLTGRPHLAWNILALASALPSDGGDDTVTLDGLAAFATGHDLWFEIASADRLKRPSKPRIDQAITSLSAVLARASRAAAAPLGAEADRTALAAHLLTVPSDLFLYVLATVPVPVEPIRRTLLEQLPRRLGHGLAARAGFPRSMAPLFGAGELNPIAAAVHVARESVPQGALLPQIARDPEAVFALAGPDAAAAAVRAARDAAREVG